MGSNWTNYYHNFKVKWKDRLINVKIIYRWLTFYADILLLFYDSCQLSTNLNVSQVGWKVDFAFENTETRSRTKQLKNVLYTSFISGTLFLFLLLLFYYPCSSPGISHRLAHIDESISQCSVAKTRSQFASDMSVRKCITLTYFLSGYFHKSMT